MNIVKLQNELQYLSLPILTAKAQGQDPEVPAWLATIVLNQRLNEQKKADMARGASGDQPSVNEQLLQKAELMALQDKKQQQAQQQMMDQMVQVPQPAPEGVPQPEAQPEPQMMAQGGLAGLSVNPSMFDYKEGGIIGFDGGERSDVPESEEDKKQRQTRQDIEAMLDTLRKFNAAENAPTVPPEAGDMGARDRGLFSIARKPPATPSVARPTISQLPAQAPAGITTLPPAKEYDPIAMAKEAQAAFPQMRKEPSIDDLLAEKKRFREAAGALPAGEPQRQELEAYRAESERIRKEREKSDAIAALSGYGGLAELAQRSAAISQRNILADTIRNDAAAKMQAAMEGMKQAEAAGNQKEYNEQKEKYINAQDARANAGVLAVNELSKTAMTTAEMARGHDIQANIENARIKSNEKVAELDRKLRIDLHNTPAAQKLTTEENAIQDYMVQLKIPYSQAYEMVKTVSASLKGAMTLDQATDNVQKFLDSNPMYIRNIQEEAKKAGKPVPDVYTIRMQLIKREMSGAANPSAKSSPLLSEADKIVGVK